MNTKTYTMGLDLGDRHSTYCLLDANGKTVEEEAVATSREGFEALSKQHPQAVIAMETGTHSPWVSRLFEAGGHKVYVANTCEAIISPAHRQVAASPGTRLLFLLSEWPICFASKICTAT